MNVSNATAPPLIDSHAHLDSEDFASDLDDVVARALAAGLVGILTVGIQPADWQPSIDIARRYHEVRAILGVHPNSASQATDGQLSRLQALAQENQGDRVVAIGEIGLDFYRDFEPRATQKSAFRAQLELARFLDLPVVIHCRDAHADVLEIIKRDGTGTRGVMHSFSGDVPYMEECLRLGYLISISGPVTFKKAVDKHTAAQRVPLDCLMIETDCPYLTPEPYRGRRNEPAYVAFTAAAVARHREMSVERLAVATTNNASRLFGLGLEQSLGPIQSFAQPEAQA